MLLRSTTKPPILGVLTNIHISEAFRIDFVTKPMLLRSKTKPHYFSIRGVCPNIVVSSSSVLTKQQYNNNNNNNDDDDDNSNDNNY